MRALRTRLLEAWARKEAESRAEGWSTVSSEWKVEPITCVLDGESFGLHGRLDRVDRRERDGQVEIRVLDYKSGDQPSELAKAFAPRLQRWRCDCVFTV